MARTIANSADELASLLSLLGNTKRLLIVSHLLEQEMSVGRIAESVDLSQSALSQHLAKLRAAGLVTTRREKQTIYYSCNSQLAQKLFDTLEEVCNEPEMPLQDGYGGDSATN